MRIFRNTYVRVGVQVGVGTMLLMSIFSTPAVWDALALDPVLANPALIMMLFGLVMLVNLGTGLAATQLAAEVFTGSLLGGSVGLACVYLAILANNGSSTSVIKAAVTWLLSGLGLLVLTLYRFKHRQWNMFFTLASITLAINASGSYYQTKQQYKFTLYWWMFAAISSVSALLCSTFILPVPAGMRVRKELAKALQGEGQLLVGVMELMTGEILESGLLARATGETSKRIGIDAGLFDSVTPLYAIASANAVAIQTAWRFLDPAKLELHVYGRQKVFPGEAYNLLCLLARGRLSTLMMLIYPLQSGRMHCGLCSRLGIPLRQLAASYKVCCDRIASVILHGAPLASAIEDLKAVEAVFAELSSQTRALQRISISQDALALDMVLSLLFTAATRVRRMFALLPQALGRDQPGSVGIVLSHFQASTGWDFHAMTQVPPGRTSSLDLVRESLLASGLGAAATMRKRTRSSQALDLMARPSLKVLPAHKGDPTGQWRLLWQARQLWLRTGFSTQHLRLGLQMVVAYSILLVMVMIADVDDAFNGRLYWAIFIVVAILEPSTGGVVFKGMCRFVGTVLGGLGGLGSMYFTYLCNGLSYKNNPQKFVVMTLCMGLLSGMGAAAAVRFNKYAYAYIISVVLLCMIALPGYSTDTPLPLNALWRLVTTVLGVVLEVLVATVVFPITARDTFAHTMASILESMADLTDTIYQVMLPSSSNGELRSSSGVSLPPSPPLHTPPQTSFAADGQLRAAASQEIADRLEREAEDEVKIEMCEDRRGAHPMQPAYRSEAPAAAQHGTAGASRVGCASDHLGPAASTTFLAHQDSSAPELQPGAVGVSSAAVVHAQLASRTFSGQRLPASRAYPTVTEDEGAEGGLLGDNPGGAVHEGLPEELDSGDSLQGGSPRRLGGTSSHISSRSMATQLSLLDAMARGRAHRQGHFESGFSPTARTAARGVSLRQGTGPRGGVNGGPHSQVSSEQASLGGLSVHIPLAATTQKVLGSVFVRILPGGLKTGAGIVALLQLGTPLKYEYYPFSASHRFPFETAYRAQRLCRHMLNVLAAFAITMDSQDVKEVKALIPHADRVECLLKQLRECLLAFAGMVKGHVDLRSAVDMVMSLEQHAVRLFMAVLLHGLDSEDARGSDAEAMQALAFVAMMFNATYVARLLCIALAQTFCTQHHPGKSTDYGDLGEASRWAVGDDLMLVAAGVLGMALGATSDPGTPRTILSVYSSEVGHGGMVASQGAVAGHVEHPAAHDEALGRSTGAASAII